MSRAIPEDAAVILEGRDLTVVLGGQKVVDVSSFSVREGEVMMIIGPNGSGKTTLLLTLALLLKPASGSILYRSKPLIARDSILHQRRKLAVVFQEPLLLNSSVIDNVTLGLKLRGVPRHAVRRRAEKWLERFGILELAKRQARLLSGGEAKRASLARAFALEPEVLFLDEPFIALDTPTRRGLLEDFESVLQETKTTVLMVTHDRDEALTLGDRIAVILKGAIRQVGTSDEIFSAPIDDELATFIEAGNVLQSVIARQENGIVCLDINGRQIQVVSELPAGNSVVAYINYEDITLVLPQAEPARSSARNQLTGTITRALLTGSQMKVFLDCGFPLVTLITKRSWEEMGLDIGKTVIASFKASSVHLLQRYKGEK